MVMSKVAFIQSDERSYNIERSLSLIKSEIIAGLREAKNIVIKPNCVSDSVALAATHADALEAVLGFIRPYVQSQITLAEGTGIGTTLNAFKNFGYLDLQNRYDFAIIDLNTDDFDLVELVDRRGRPWQAQVAKTLLRSDYLISVSPPKTHNVVVYTGAVKNVAVGGLLRRRESVLGRLANILGAEGNDKVRIHQGLRSTNENIRRLYEKIPLKLAVIDGFEAMEGDGPIEGKPVHSHFALASSDPLAADWLACQLMEIKTSDVGYLALLRAKEEEHLIIGDDWQKAVKPFQMHKDFEKIRHWR